MGATHDQLRTDTGEVYDEAQRRYESLADVSAVELRGDKLPSDPSPGDILRSTGTQWEHLADTDHGKLHKVVEGTVNAGHPDFTDPYDTTTRAGRASAVDDAITFAGNNSHSLCLVPDSLLNYDASSVTFDNSVRMVREGQQADVYDVKAYGAAGDGTTDDSAAINAAASAAINVQGKLVFSGEDYNAPSAKIVLGDSDHLIVEGAGKESTSVTTSGDFIEAIATASGTALQLVVRDLDIEGDGTGTGVDLRFGMRRSRLDSVRIDNFNVGLHIEATWIATFIDVLAVNCTAQGIELRGTDGVTTCTFIGCAAEACDVGLLLRGAGISSNKFIGFVAEGNSTSEVEIRGDDGQVLHNRFWGLHAERGGGVTPARAVFVDTGAATRSNVAGTTFYAPFVSGAYADHFLLNKCQVVTIEDPQNGTRATTAEIRTGSEARQCVVRGAPDQGFNSYVVDLSGGAGHRYTAATPGNIGNSSISISSGWGDTATVAFTAGSQDNRFRFTVNASGTGFSANPTITLDFKQGFGGADPFASIVRNGGDQPGVDFDWTISDTQIVITWRGTPVDTESYTFEGVVTA